ncbi:putative lysozyme-like protein isoform X2 [Rhipicephalus sanguineus]|uniref:putative lysozyme-like protein isoform X2 n=1 Tax=Rhipicephalus sanguineus TaxID=34632 RepID=UPI001895B2F4|nr:putative lysozyme-like protein isoform X2 [Rhipicephalus sanguineus]XP_049275754.1 putative lysozyme-like protein isoform X2 [Rhipicephalus sanguineus]
MPDLSMQPRWRSGPEALRPTNETSQISTGSTTSSATTSSNTSGGTTTSGGSGTSSDASTSGTSGGSSAAGGAPPAPKNPPLSGHIGRVSELKPMTAGETSTISTGTTSSAGSDSSGSSGGSASSSGAASSTSGSNDSSTSGGSNAPGGGAPAPPAQNANQNIWKMSTVLKGLDVNLTADHQTTIGTAITNQGLQVASFSAKNVRFKVGHQGTAKNFVQNHTDHEGAIEPIVMELAADELDVTFETFQNEQEQPPTSSRMTVAFHANLTALAKKFTTWLSSTVRGLYD